MKDSVREELASLAERVPELSGLKNQIAQAVEILCAAARADRKILICGNGGSAADSEHISGELLKEFKVKRPMPEAFVRQMAQQFGEEGERLAAVLQRGIQAVPLVSLMSLSTAYMNDAEPAAVFAQGVCALGRGGDVLIAISTSGNSKNVVYAMQAARVLGLKIIALTGETGGRMRSLCDVLLNVPARETYRVQELHLPVYHTLCAAVERDMFCKS